MTRTPPGQHGHPGIDFDFKPFDAAKLGKIIALVTADSTKKPPKPKAVVIKSLNMASAYWNLGRNLEKAPSERDVRKALSSLKSASARMLKLLPIDYDEPAFPHAPDQEFIVGTNPPDCPQPETLNDEGAAPEDKRCESTRPDLRVNPHVADGIAYPLDPAMRRLMKERIAKETDKCGNGPAPEEIFGAATPGDVLLVLSEILGILHPAAEEAIAAIGTPARANFRSADREFAYKLCDIYTSLFDAPIQFRRTESGGIPGGPLIRFLRACFDAVGAKPADETLADWIEAAKKQTGTPDFLA